MRKIKNNSGFSLIETMVVASVMAIGMLGLTGLMISSIQAGTTNQDRLIASMLAQEGLELVRNIRDENILDMSYDVWTTGIISGADYTFAIDFNRVPDHAVNLITDNGARLFFDANGFYTHAVTAATTGFRRLITIEQFPPAPAEPDYINLKSTVRWSDQRGTHNYVAETYFYNWR